MADLFDRQASLGLNISKAIVIYVTADTIDFFASSGHLFNDVRRTAANAFAELVEGVALMGVQNINIVFGNDSLRHQADNIYNICPFLKDMERYRPYVNIIACDDKFIEVNKDIFGEHNGFVFHYPMTAVNEPFNMDSETVDGALTFKDAERDIDVQELLSNFVLLDFSHMVTGRFSDPFYTMFDFCQNAEDHGLQTVAPLYTQEEDGEQVPVSKGLFVDDPSKQWIATSTLVLLAVNISIKPKFASDKYVSAVKYLDTSVTNVMNKLQIRPRWKKQDD